MTTGDQYIASIQQVDDSSATFSPLPGEADIVQISNSDVYDLLFEVADVIMQHPDVYDFDIILTNRTNAPNEDQ